jgi:hypothetical protein
MLPPEHHRRLPTGQWTAAQSASGRASIWFCLHLQIGPAPEFLHPRLRRQAAEAGGPDGDLEDFGVLLERLADGQAQRSLIYSGLRGLGKTVLLLEFETLARVGLGM